MTSRNASTDMAANMRSEFQDGSRERRKSARYVPVLDRALLGCWERDEFRTAPVRILNVSLGGAALLLECPAPAASSIWVCLAGTDQPSWIAAERVAIDEAGGNRCVVRLAFAEPLSYELFRTVVWGFPEEERPRVVTEPEAAPQPTALVPATAP